MVTLKNVVTEIDGTFEVEDSKEMESRKASYADLLKIVIMQLTPANTVGAQRKDFRVMDVLDAAIKNKSETLEFENSDFEYLQSKFVTTNFGFKHRGLLTLEDDINEAKKNG